jgi:GNAT superfamily N-acetyltransferase
MEVCLNMKVTGIAPDNAEYFINLVPDGALDDENIFWLGAVAQDGTACAVLGAGVIEDIAYIDWIYTDASYRRQGAARNLLKWLKILLRKIGVGILEVSFSDDDEDLEEFLESQGFFFDDDTDIYSVPVRDLIWSDTMDITWQKHRTGCKVVTLKDFGREDEFYEYLQKKGIPFGVESDESDYSLIRLDGKGDIDGCMLLYRRLYGELEGSYMVSDSASSGAVDLFLAFRDLIGKMNWQDENIVFADRSGEIIKTLETISKTDRDSYIVTGRKLAMTTL